MARLGIFLAAGSLWAACGPIQSTAYLMDADVQLEAARTASADKYAPYEWTQANLYLNKAREEVGSSEYEVAVELARKAKQTATQARDKAMAHPRADAPTSP